MAKQQPLRNALSWLLCWRTNLRPWLRLIKPGDWLIMSLALALNVTAFTLLWRGGAAQQAIVRLDGEIIAKLPLDTARRIEVQGAMTQSGVTVIETAPGRARIARDPGPHQYCVKQGWLTQANAIAICAPSHISLSLSGGDQGAGYDTLSY